MRFKKFTGKETLSKRSVGGSTVRRQSSGHFIDHLIIWRREGGVSKMKTCLFRLKIVLRNYYDGAVWFPLSASKSKSDGDPVYNWSSSTVQPTGPFCKDLQQLRVADWCHVLSTSIFYSLHNYDHILLMFVMWRKYLSSNAIYIFQLCFYPMWQAVSFGGHRQQ